MSKTKSLKNDIIKNFGTPCVVVDLNVLEKNITRVQKICDREGVSNRPHIKWLIGVAFSKSGPESGPKMRKEAF